VTLFETHVATFRFFDRRADLADLEPKIIAIVDNLRLHTSEEDLLASTEAVDIPDGVDTAAFRRNSITGGFPYLLCLTTIAVIGGLAIVERRIRRKRYEAQIAEVEKAQAERKARTVKRESRENSAAAEYLQAAAKRPHLRRE